MVHLDREIFSLNKSFYLRPKVFDVVDNAHGNILTQL